MKRLVSILLWSAISAAFIGSGTVTTASAAGAELGIHSSWVLVFSIIACLSLQEASARLAIVTGKPLARTMNERFGRGRAGRWVPAAVVGAVVLGCTAYQAGNLLGAVAGVTLGWELDGRVIAWVTALLAAGVLLAGTARVVARILGMVVAFMGVAFLVCAFQIWFGPALAAAESIPISAAGSPSPGMLILALVGTTVVPYNLFLGSGLAKGQRLSDARFGLAVAVPLGGIISIGILVVGTAVEPPLTFEGLSSALKARMGDWAALLFALGLFTAGFSSAITAPLAGALSMKGFLQKKDDLRWKESAWRYRAVWLGILVFGMGFSLAGVQPISAILLAQALNGVILPLVAVFLWIAVNDRSLMGEKEACGRAANIVLGCSVFAALMLGSSAVVRACASVMGLGAPPAGILLSVTGSVSAMITLWVLFRIRQGRVG
ncbi:MAG: divalent metal cation transporter [Planctomycetes bacterium]|nr:divalent metal cation transporter [Planctomycetota bacterium]